MCLADNLTTYLCRFSRNSGKQNNVRMDLQEVGLGYEGWIGLAQNRDGWRALVGAVRNLWVP